MILLRGLWSLFVSAVTLVGVIIGGYVHKSMETRLPDNLSEFQEVSFQIGLMVVGGLLGFLFALYSFRALVSYVNKLNSVPLLDKVAAAIGVLLGLIVGLLATAPVADLPGLGLPIRIFASVFCVILGVGFAVSAKEQIVYVFPSLATRTPDLDVQGVARSKMLDTNIIIDGRIADIYGSGFLEGSLLVPGFVLNELHHIADSPDSLKRARGRRGLEVLNRLKKIAGSNVRIFEEYSANDSPAEEVDNRLVKLAKDIGSVVITNDYSVNEIAKLHNVNVLNVNELASALRPVYLPGEEVMVNIVKEGKEPGQGVAYLDDGTMVVVERASRLVGQIIPAVVTSALQTTAGKMIFADLAGDTSNARPQENKTRS